MSTFEPYEALLGRVRAEIDLRDQLRRTFSEAQCADVGRNLRQARNLLTQTNHHFGATADVLVALSCGAQLIAVVNRVKQSQIDLRELSHEWRDTNPYRT